LLAQPVRWPVNEGGNGHFYEYVAASSIAWAAADAEARSRSYGGLAGHLATATSSEENQFLLAQVVAPDSLEVWIGGFQPEGEDEPLGGWRWVSGEPWQFTHWQLGEPNDAGNEDHLGMVVGDGGRWNDEHLLFNISGFVVEYGTDEIVYDGLADNARWGWGFTDPGEPWSFEEHDGGIEREAMLADYIGLAGTARYGTLLEFGKKNFNSDSQIGRADLILRLHEIKGGLPGDVFWSTTIEGVEFERTGIDRVEPVALNTWLPDEFFFSFEAVNVTDPGFGVLFAGTDRLPWVGTGDEVIYQLDSDTLEWELDDSGPTSISMRIHAIPTCRADINGDGTVNTQDFIAYLNAWASGDPLADWNADGTVNSQDFIAYLNDWAAGC